MIVMTGTAKHKKPKYFQGKKCPDPLKGEGCPLCGKQYVCLAETKEAKKK